MASKNPARAEGAVTPKRAGRFSYDGLDRVMHEKARLGILASLATSNGVLSFNDLKQLCSLTDGNLSRHLTVLQEAGFVEQRKGSAGSRPASEYRLTTLGRQRFTAYIDVLEKVVADAHALRRTEGGASGAAPAWSSS